MKIAIIIIQIDTILAALVMLLRASLGMRKRRKLSSLNREFFHGEISEEDYGVKSLEIADSMLSGRLRDLHCSMWISARDANDKMNLNSSLMNKIKNNFATALSYAAVVSVKGIAVIVLTILL